MVKIMIIARGGPSPSRRDALPKALFDARIRVLQYYKVHEEDLAILINLGFTPALPLDMEVKLTLIFDKLDQTFGQRVQVNHCR